MICSYGLISREKGSIVTLKNKKFTIVYSERLINLFLAILLILFLFYIHHNFNITTLLNFNDKKILPATLFLIVIIASALLASALGFGMQHITPTVSILLAYVLLLLIYIIFTNLHQTIYDNLKNLFKENKKDAQDLIDEAKKRQDEALLNNHTYTPITLEKKILIF